MGSMSGRHRRFGEWAAEARLQAAKEARLAAEAEAAAKAAEEARLAAEAEAAAKAAEAARLAAEAEAAEAARLQAELKAQQDAEAAAAAAAATAARLQEEHKAREEAEVADAKFHREQRQARQREAEEVARLGSFTKAASVFGETVQRKAPSLSAHGPAYPAQATSLASADVPAPATAPDGTGYADEEDYF